MAVVVGVLMVELIAVFVLPNFLIDDFLDSFTSDFLFNFADFSVLTILLDDFCCFDAGKFTDCFFSLIFGLESIVLDCLFDLA